MFLRKYKATPIVTTTTSTTTITTTTVTIPDEKIVVLNNLVEVEESNIAETKRPQVKQDESKQAVKVQSKQIEAKQTKQKQVESKLTVETKTKQAEIKPAEPRLIESKQPEQKLVESEAGQKKLVNPKLPEPKKVVETKPVESKQIKPKQLVDPRLAELKKAAETKKVEQKQAVTEENMPENGYCFCQKKNDKVNAKQCTSCQQYFHVRCAADANYQQAFNVMSDKCALRFVCFKCRKEPLLVDINKDELIKSNRWDDACEQLLSSQTHMNPIENLKATTKPNEPVYINKSTLDPFSKRLSDERTNQLTSQNKEPFASLQQNRLFPKAQPTSKPANERPVTSDAQTRGSNASKCMENQPLMWSSSSSSSSIVITKKKTLPNSINVQSESKSANTATQESNRTEKNNLVTNHAKSHVTPIPSITITSDKETTVKATSIQASNHSPSIPVVTSPSFLDTIPLPIPSPIIAAASDSSKFKAAVIVNRHLYVNTIWTSVCEVLNRQRSTTEVMRKCIVNRMRNIAAVPLPIIEVDANNEQMHARDKEAMNPGGFWNGYLLKQADYIVFEVKPDDGSTSYQWLNRTTKSPFMRDTIVYTTLVEYTEKMSRYVHCVVPKEISAWVKHLYLVWVPQKEGDDDLNRFRIPLNRKDNHFLVIAILNPKLNRPVNISGDVINRDSIPSKTNEPVWEKKSNDVSQSSEFSAAQSNQTVSKSVEEAPKKRLVDPRLLRTNRQNSVDSEPSPASNQNSPPKEASSSNKQDQDASSKTNNSSPGSWIYPRLDALLRNLMTGAISVESKAELLGIFAKQIGRIKDEEKKILYEKYGTYIESIYAEISASTEQEQPQVEEKRKSNSPQPKATTTTVEEDDLIVEEHVKPTDEIMESSLMSPSQSPPKEQPEMTDTDILIQQLRLAPEDHIINVHVPLSDKNNPKELIKLYEFVHDKPNLIISLHNENWAIPNSYFNLKRPDSNTLGWHPEERVEEVVEEEEEEEEGEKEDEPPKSKRIVIEVNKEQAASSSSSTSSSSILSSSSSTTTSTSSLSSQTSTDSSTIRYSSRHRSRSRIRSRSRSRSRSPIPRRHRPNSPSFRGRRSPPQAFRHFTHDHDYHRRVVNRHPRYHTNRTRRSRTRSRSRSRSRTRSNRASHYYHRGRDNSPSRGRRRTRTRSRSRSRDRSSRSRSSSSTSRSSSSRSRSRS